MTEQTQSSANTAPGSRSYLRFPFSARLLHWVAAASIFVLLWSGLWIFNIHPRLYWGDYGYFGSPAIAELAADTSTEPPQMTIKVGDIAIDVTGLIGQIRRQPFVRLANYPQGFDFGGNRALHFTAAWVLIIAWLYYVSHLLSSGRLKKVWLPKSGETSVRHIGKDILNHIKLRRPKGEEILNYNILQKLSYLFLMFVLLPLILLTGLTMSNSITTAWPFLFDIFGGRQSARTLHFIFATMMLLFILVHLVQLFVVGFVNHLRSMITGKLTIDSDSPHHDQKT